MQFLCGLGGICSPEPGSQTSHVEKDLQKFIFSAKKEFPFSMGIEFLFPIKLLVVKVLTFSLEQTKAGFEKFPLNLLGVD